MAKRINPRRLLKLAAQVRERAYAPYSQYSVGAAVVGKSGRVYVGCNVENASYGLTVCAERTALFKGISEGEREFQAIAVVTPSGGSPCGACRQVLSEFMPPHALVVLGNAQGEPTRLATLGELLPDAFTPQRLRAGQRAVKRAARRTTSRSHRPQNR